MFEIIIKNLRLFGYHGVNDDEKIKGQEFLFNINIFLDKDVIDEKMFLKSDNIKNTVNYSEVISIIKDINSNQRFNLLEALVRTIAKKILFFSPLIKKVIVRVDKTSPPIVEKIESAGVRTEVCKETIKNEKKMKRVFLSLGSNMGDREKNLRDAVKEIGKNKRIEIINISSIYETEPMYLKKQDWFYNIAIEVIVESGFDPFEMLGYLKSIEYSMGRSGDYKKNGPRIIDIDILYFDSVEITSEFLIIPHPEIAVRKFVLMPLNELEPELLVRGEKTSNLLKSSRLKEKVKKIKKW